MSDLKTGQPLKGITIYGEEVEGLIVRVMENVIVIKDNDGEGHVIHKETLNNRHKRFKGWGNNRHPSRFDLKGCMERGVKARYLMRGRKYVS